jgi:hypothetical protein
MATQTTTTTTTTTNILESIRALPRTRLLDMARLSEADIPRLGLTDDDVLWAALCGGDSMVRPQPTRRAQAVVAKELGLHISDAGAHDFEDAARQIRIAIAAVR